MKTSRPHYQFIDVLPERSANHPFARLVVIYDNIAKRYFTANTCDVHLRLAPHDGGAPSQYDQEEIIERLTMLHGH